MCSYLASINRLRAQRKTVVTHFLKNIYEEGKHSKFLKFNNIVIHNPLKCEKNYIIWIIVDFDGKVSYYSFTTQMTSFTENIGIQNCSTSDTSFV